MTMNKRNHSLEIMSQGIPSFSNLILDKLQQSTQHILKVFLTLVLIFKPFQLFCDS